MKKFLIGAAVLLGACGISEDKFTEDFGSTFCEKTNECLEAEGLDTIDCDADTEDGEAAADVECDFDPAAAKDCLSELDAAECDGPVISTPSVCADVFTNCTTGEDGEDGEDTDGGDDTNE